MFQYHEILAFAGMTFFVMASRRRRRGHPVKEQLLRISIISAIIKVARPFGDKYNEFITMKKEKNIFGYHSVKSVLLHSPKHVVTIYLQSKKYNDHANEVLSLAQEHEIAIKYLSREQLGEMVYNANHQGIVASINRTSDYNEDDLKEILQDTNIIPLILILDGVKDPHNLGACLRTANAAGVHAVVIPKDRACGLTPVVYKVASGAAEVTPLIQVTNLARTIRMLQEMNIWICGTTDDATQDIYSIDFRGPMALVLGAEEDGMRQLTRKHCDFIAKIPMNGTVSSLNVSVATGVCLFEAVRQRIGARS